jgi:pyrroloquinoline quinone biosynthesis protein B
MWLQVLGAAAGGGLPQWNCSCSNCLLARSSSSRVSPRSQSQLAVSGDGVSWYLINASPDLRDQLSRSSQFHPDSTHGLRHTPVAGILLTSADLDHILGLLLMREFTSVSIFATASVHKVLESNPFFSMLDRLPGQSRRQTLAHGSTVTLGCGLQATMIELPGNFPAYLDDQARSSLLRSEMTIGLVFASGAGKRVAYLPALPAITPGLLSTLESCDVILVDGTFWSDDELQRLQPGTPTATQMGHLPIDGATGSLRGFAGLAPRRRIYTHINNTNPILDPHSVEHRTVTDLGFEIACDGMEIEL